MNPESPKVSVIIPHYNMHSYLPAAVASVKNQDYENIELIVVDDGSEESVESEELAVNTLTVKLLEVEHGGKARAVNRGFEEAIGQYLAVLDADDRLPPGSLSRRIQALEQDEADLAIGSFDVHYQGKVKAERLVDRFFGESNDRIIQALLTNIITPFHQNAMLFSGDLLKSTGSMDPQMLRGQDKDFAVRLLQHSEKTVLINDSVYIYNRYDRLLSRRLFNRCIGMKYKLTVVSRYTKGWRRFLYLGWNILIEVAKLVHDLFRVYKR